MIEEPDWPQWHTSYDDQSSSLWRRLQFVQNLIRTVLAARAGTPTRIISACAGEGRDVIDVVAEHAAPDSVQALLIERTPDVAAVARRSVARHALRNFIVAECDAGLSDAYATHVPADLLLFCGVFAWISEDEMFRAIDFLPRLAAPGATVIWTLHSREPDRNSAARGRFSANGFVEDCFVHLPGGPSTVGVHRLVGEPAPFATGVQLFRFASVASPTRP